MLYAVEARVNEGQVNALVAASGSHEVDAACCCRKKAGSTHASRPSASRPVAQVRFVCCRERRCKAARLFQLGGIGPATNKYTAGGQTESGEV